MNKFLEITKSWITAVNPNEKQQSIADQRIAVCNNCDSRKYNDIADFFYCGEYTLPLSGQPHSPQ